MKIARTYRTCEVLIVGGGAAALMAGLAAASQGAKVTIVCKSRVGRSGNTVISASGLSTFIPFDGSEDSQERFFQDTMAGGKFINDDSLVKVLTSQSGERVLKAVELGIRLGRKNGGYDYHLAPGHSCPRTIIYAAP